MAYATAAKIKERCNIRSHDVSHNTELANAVVYGDLWVDMILGRYGVSASGNATLSAEAANDFGAYYFLRNRNPKSAMQYRADALELLSAYIFGQTGQVVRTRGPPVPTDLDTSEL